MHLTPRAVPRTFHDCAPARRSRRCSTPTGVTSTASWSPRSARTDADDCYQETWLAALRAYPQLRDASQPARLAVHDRPSQGDRPRPRAGHAGPRRWPTRPSWRRRAPVGGRRPHRGPTEICGRRSPRCPPKQRTAVALRFIADSAYAEIAGAMDCSEEAARRNVHEGLKRLRKEHQDDRVRSRRARADEAAARCCRSRRADPRPPRRRRSPTRRPPPACSTSPTRSSTRRSAVCCWRRRPRDWRRSPISTRDARGRRPGRDGGPALAPGALAAPRRLDEPRRELDEYFAGRRRELRRLRSTCG